MARHGVIKDMLKKRLTKLRSLLMQYQLDGLVVSLPANRRYLSGFTQPDGQWGESSGWLLIAPAAAMLITDSRYELSAREQAPLFELVLHRQGLAKQTAALAADLGIKRLGIEADGMLVMWQQALAKELDQAEIKATRGLTGSLRLRKDPTEVAALMASLGLMETVLADILSQDLAGRSERELALAITRGVEDAGAEGAAFDPIVAVGPNAAEPHAQPGQRILEPGQTALFDVGAMVDGYCSDISRTVVVGGLDQADDTFRRVYPVVRQAQVAAIAGIRVGMTGAEADALARDVITEAGFGDNFGHSLGHGVGLATHEAPSLAPRSSDVLMAGMVFTIEPGIYLPGWGGVRLEQMVLLEDRGCRLLNGLDDFYQMD